MNGFERYEAATPGDGANLHAWVSLLSGAFALSCVIPLVLILWNPTGLSTEVIKRFWTLYAFLSVFLGLVAIATGATGWNAVKRGEKRNGGMEAVTGISLGLLVGFVIVVMLGYIGWLVLDFLNSVDHVEVFD